MHQLGAAAIPEHRLLLVVGRREVLVRQALLLQGQVERQQVHLQEARVAGTLPTGSRM